MKSILSVYLIILSVYLSFVVAFAILVGAAGFYAPANGSPYVQDDWTATGGAMRGIGR
jgi:hypothetical protein